jgi:adenosylcobinamide-phosphate synthase
VTSPLDAWLILSLAIAFDLAIGDPPNRLHPVAWMGSVIAAVQRRAATEGRMMPLLCGLFLMIFGIALAATIGWLISSFASRLPYVIGIVVQALVLKTMLSIRGLMHAGREVQQALSRGDLPAARRLVSWRLVSRDTSTLNESQVAAATIESLAENVSDSVVAPLLYYLLFGLPGALAYRFINTCDAMLGYRDAQREWLGKAPARVDDLANLLPARLSATAVVLGAALSGHDARQAIAIWRRDRRLTASPNAGQPMAAAAGALGVRLEKVGHYCLGRELRLPEAADIARAIRLLAATVGLLYVVGSCCLNLAWLAR